MDVKITRENPILVKAAVDIPWERVAPHQKKALQEIRGMAQLPGFRKGKAPAALLKKRFKNEIIQEIMRSLLPDCIQEVIKGENLKSVAQPRLIDVDLVDKQHFHFEAEIDVKPEIELQEWEGIEVETLKIDITSEMVDTELNTMVEHDTKREEITDRAAEDGDQVTLGLTALDTEAGDSLTDLESYVLTLGAEDAHPKLSEMVRGQEKEADLEAEYEAPEDDSFTDWVGKKVKLYVEVKEIARMVKPELNDEYAKTKEAESLDDLRSKTETRMREEAENQEQNRVDNALMGKILQGYDFQVPEEWVRNEARLMVEQQMAPYMQMLQGQGEREREQMMNGMLQYTMPQAAGKVRADVILDTLAEKLELAVPDAELDEELEGYRAYMQVESVDALKKQLTDNGMLDNILEAIRRRKAVEAIRGAAKLTEVDELTKEEEDTHDHEHVHGPDCDHDHDHDHADAEGDAPDASEDTDAPADDEDASKNSN